MQAGVVTDRDLGHEEAGLIEFSSHFDADHSASGFQRDGFKYATPKEPEVTIHIAYREVKGPAHRSTIDFSDQHTMPAVGASNLIAIHEIDAGAKLRQ
jgi:hypothetical protein